MGIAAIVEYHPKDGKAGKVEANLRGMIGAVRGEPGCLLYDLMRSKDGSVYVLCEAYVDMAAVAAHRASDHYRDYRARIDPLLAAPIAPDILRHDRALIRRAVARRPHTLAPDAAGRARAQAAPQR
jgi:quinol monooxygenase YgiN